MPTKNPLPDGKDTELNAVVTELGGIAVQESRQMVDQRVNKEGQTVDVVENLSTILMQDGTTLTLNLDDTNHTEVLRQVFAKIESDIAQGKRKRV